MKKKNFFPYYKTAKQIYIFRENGYISISYLLFFWEGDHFSSDFNLNKVVSKNLLWTNQVEQENQKW